MNLARKDMDYGDLATQDSAYWDPTCSCHTMDMDPEEFPLHLFAELVLC